jgi:hypothetical protein
MCLSQLKFKSRTNVEELKFEVSMKKGIATLLMHWRKFIKANLVMYSYKPNRWNKFWMERRKKIERKFNNRQKFLQRSREEFYQGGGLFYWRTIMKEFW